MIVFRIWEKSPISGEDQRVAGEAYIRISARFFRFAEFPAVFVFLPGFKRESWIFLLAFFVRWILGNPMQGGMKHCLSINPNDGCGKQEKYGNVGEEFHV